MEGKGSKREGKAEENAYADLPSPTLNAKIVHLAPELKAQHPKHKREEIAIRKCLLTYAREAETQRERMLRYGMTANLNENSRDHVQSKTPVLGSEERNVMPGGNYGFLTTVMEAYNKHYSLRTCVEDWWYTIIRKIAVAIDDNSKSDKVRDFFVSHEGKKTLTVEVGPDIYGVDYSWFLDQMTNQIAENIKVPNYVDLLKADYSTSTKTHAIESEITVMSSVQEYFEFEMMTMCGIPSLQMEGEEGDWKRMKSKFLQLKELLIPIHKEIGLREKWWNGVEGICEHLINTFNGKPDVKWWSNIFTFEAAWGSGEQDTYDGWFISQLLGLGSIHSLTKLNNGIVTVPMKITNGMTGVSEDSAFAAGIVGFEMFKEKDSSWPSVKAVHGWTLMLEPNSTYRDDLIKWESQLIKGA